MTTPILRLLPRLGALITLFFGLAMIPKNFLEPGIDTPSPISPFINGILPTTTPTSGSGDWILVDAFPSLDFNTPIHLEQEPGTNRLFIGEHAGRIYAFENNETTDQKTLILDIRNQTFLSGEAGLLCFTFHPKYGIDNRYIYVFYQYRLNNQGRAYSRLSRFEVPENGDPVNIASEQVLIHLYDRQNNHNGGALLFGEDGFLYVSTGDEGGGNNTYRNSQEIDNRLLGGVLRIDVDQDPSKSHPIRRQPRLLDGDDESFTANYYVPNDNPFLDESGGVLEEFYALGLRNPHRMTKDPVTQDIWIGDVGQGRREEISLLVKGGNFQWGYKEGELNGPQGQPNPLIGSDEDPIYTYPHGNGDNCIIGGYVYRDNRLPALSGKYIFADNGSGRIWSMQYNPGQEPVVEELMVANVGGGKQGISAFGTDANNELYVLRYGGAPGGKVYIFDREQAASPEPPARLSETGIFDDLTTLAPADGIFPYSPNLPFWSDGALKYRWVAIPNDGTHDQPNEQVIFSENDPWKFPIGTVFIKHFELPLDRRNTTQTKRIETRLMIHGEDGNYFGVTYKWLEDGSDAILLTEGMDETLDITDINGQPTTQIWKYPSRDECFICHKESTGSILGVNTRQLNGDITYPSSGKRANQLITWDHLNIFDQGVSDAEVAGFEKTVTPDDDTATLALRARSYLDVNCGYCHNPNTGVLAEFDTRLFTPLESQNLINGDLRDNLGVDGSKVIVPGDTALSALYVRMNRAHDEIAMPPLAKNVIDQEGVALIADWIFSMVEREAQSIQFNDIVDKLTTDPPFELQASATSGLPVTFTIISGPASVDESIVTLTGDTGTVVIEAQQPGNEAFDPADSVRKTFRVIAPPKQTQTITFTPIPDKLATDDPFEITAIASSTLPVNFILISGPATLNDNLVTLTGATGVVTIEAQQPGNEEFEAATSVSLSFSVSNPIDPGCPPINFKEHNFTSYGYLQDQGEVNINESGDEITLTNNAWKAISFPYTITENTVLEFEFKSTSIGDLHAIGLDNNNWQTHAHTFKLHGTQPWGNTTFFNYEGDDYQLFTIPIGQFYTGDFNRIFFIADHDQIIPSGDSYFRNVKIYEGDCEGMNIPDAQPNPFCFTQGLDEVFIEAENYSLHTPALNRGWENWADDNASNQSGIYVPGEGLNTQLFNMGPRVDYSINFEETGIYYISLRTQSNSNKDNSVHIGLDQQCLTCDEGQGVGIVSNQWEWVSDIQESSTELTITIDEIGMHILSLWMREDGVKIDKIALMREPRSITGAGPIESITCPTNGNKLQTQQMIPADAQIDYEESVLTPKMEVYPNPISQDKVVMSISTIEKESFEVTLVDMTGKEIYLETLVTSPGVLWEKELSVKNLSQGVYIIHVKSLTGKHPVMTRKIERQ